MPTEPKPRSSLLSRAGHPTIATIAAHMGLSRATVTHVLNGRGAEQRISATTQERVLKAAHELGYRANAAARAVRAGRFGNIALIQSLYGQYLPNELLLGLTNAIAAKDIRFVLTQVSDVVIDSEAYLPHTLQELSADGVLINRHRQFSKSYLDRIHRLGVPAVYLNVKQEFDCVHPDDRTGGRMATEYLLGLGHERIAYIETEEPENRHYSRQDRIEGYREAMRDAGRTPRVAALPKDWRIPERPGEDGRVESALPLLAGADRPTAIVAYELAESMAVLHAAQSLGLRVPHDLCLIQFHHWIDARFFLPIHTVTNGMKEVGAQSVEMLLAKMESPQTALPARVVPVELLEGATCIPRRAQRREIA